MLKFYPRCTSLHITLAGKYFGLNNYAGPDWKVRSQARAPHYAAKFSFFDCGARCCDLTDAVQGHARGWAKNKYLFGPVVRQTNKFQTEGGDSSNDSLDRSVTCLVSILMESKSAESLDEMEKKKCCFHEVVGADKRRKSCQSIAVLAVYHKVVVLKTK